MALVITRLVVGIDAIGVIDDTAAPMTLAYGIEEPDLVHDDRRGDEQEREDHHLCRTPERPHEKGPDAEEGCPQVDEQDRLALRVAAQEQAMVDVPGVGRGDGLVLAQTAHDGGS